MEINGEDCIQTDFANEYIGGGSLIGGSVQEELMFIKCPELFASMLMFTRMHDNEAIYFENQRNFS